MSVQARDWALFVKKDRLLITARMEGLPPTAKLVRADWSLAPRNGVFLGGIVRVEDGETHARVGFHIPDRPLDNIWFRVVDAATEELLWKDHCTVIAPADDGPIGLLADPDSPDVFGGASHVLGSLLD